MDFVKKLREYILDSPGFRTFFSVVIPIVAGIFSGTFILEITTSAGLEWRTFYAAPSFYALCALSGVVYWYNRELYLYDSEIRRFLDADYCVAYMRSKCLPEAAARYQQLIRDGAGGELERAMEELQRILR